jgi:hypothetical protein
MGYSLIELSQTNLRRRHDRNAVTLPSKQIGFLDLLRAFRRGAYSSWEYGTRLTVTGVEQVLLGAADPLDLVRHIHDDVLYVPEIYESLAKLDAAIVIACDGQFAVGPNTFELLVGQTRLPLGIMLIGQPEFVERNTAKIYKVPFKLSG